MDWQSWAGVVTQIPIVALFVWFVDRMTHRQEESNAKRDEAWQAFLKAEHDSQQESRKEAMRHGMDSLLKLTECVEKLASVVHEHGKEAEERYEKITEELHAIRQVIKR